MKFHVKAFVISFLICSAVFGTAIGIYRHYYSTNITNLAADAPVEVGYETTQDESKKTELERLIDKSSRINFLLFGTDGGRSDTIMVMSYDPVNQLVDLISVPRDTYHPVEGYNHPAQKKINAVYGFKNGGGAVGLKRNISAMLKIPIAYYAQVEYDGIKKIVDSVGGVEIDVPFNMNYDDPYATPPLHIHLKKGLQTLNGDKAIQFLRWRKNNGEGGQGDIPRTGRQQLFMKEMAKKSLSIRLPVVLKTAFDYVKTDAKLDKILFIGSTAADINVSEFETHQLPGDNGDARYGYFMMDESQTEALVKRIYSKSRDASGVVLDPLAPVENGEKSTDQTKTSKSQ